MSKTITITRESPILWLNLVSIGFCILTLFFYVVTANSIAETNYKIQTFQEKIMTLTEDNSGLMSEKISKENPVVLINFAKANHFVEAHNISYIYQSHNVAQR